MQTPNVLADPGGAPRASNQTGLAEKGPASSDSDFDDAHQKAKALVVEAMKEGEESLPAEELLGMGALGQLAEGEMSLEALAEDLGISEEKLQKLLDQMRDTPVTFVSVADFEQLLDDLDIELALEPEEAQTVLAGNQGQLLSQSVTAQLAQDYLSGGGRSARAEGTMNLQAVNALAANARGEGEPEAQTRSAGTRGSEGIESNALRSLNSDSSVLLQQSNGSLRMGDAREPMGGLRQYTTSVETPMSRQEDWNEQIAGKMAWLAGKGLQSAEIHLNPPDMGPVEVRVSVQNDQAQIMVQAQQASVRDLLEQNSQRLRDMLEEQGIDLASFDVSDQGAGAESGLAGDSDEGHPGRAMAAVENGETVETGEAHITWTDGIDLYA